MSTYDKVSLSNRPTLYLSAPTITDQSGTGNFALSNNNLAADGQPIIHGSSSSFLMDSSSTVDVAGNPLFYDTATTFECVVVAGKPSEAVPIVVDDDALNGVFITQDGVSLKLFFDSTTSTYSQTATVRVKDWNAKLYILVTITNLQATIAVNGESSVISYGETETLLSSTNIVIGGGYSGYKYLIDGIGFYGQTMTNKSRIINDLGSGYLRYAARQGGMATLFNGYTSQYLHTFSRGDFEYDSDLNLLTLIYQVSDVQDGLSYLAIRVNDEDITVQYDIDLDDSGEFTEYLLVGSVADSTIRFMVDADAIDFTFQLSVEGIASPDITDATPATLELAGLALYGKPSDSLVNFPDGVLLPGATYTGTWIETDQPSPQSIELVFKPVESANDTFVYYTADGQASFGPTGSITGFDAYLNGALVTDLTGIKYDQWNHLVLVDTTAFNPISVRTNGITNPSFRVNSTGWAKDSDITATVNTTDEQWDLEANVAFIDGDVIVFNNPVVTASPTQTWSGSAVVTVPEDGSAVRLRVAIVSYNSGGTSLGGFTHGTNVTVNPGEEVTLTVDGHITPATTAGVRIIVYAGDDIGLPDGATFSVKRFLLEQSPTVGLYFDGSLPDSGGHEYAWTGTADASTSTDSLESLTFYLNSDDGVDSDETISYMILGAYPQDLTSTEILALYELISGQDKLEASETASILEGTFDNGYGFNFYSYPWAIVGAGGS